MFKLAVIGNISEREVASLVLAITYTSVLAAELSQDPEPLVIFLFTQAIISIIVYLFWIKYERTFGKLETVAATFFFAGEAALIAGAGALATSSNLGVAVATLKGLQVVIENITPPDNVDKKKPKPTTGMYLPMYHSMIDAI